MTRDLLTGNAAAAWGARLARVDYVPAYPITPQTEIIESLAGWIRSGEMKARLVTMDSEHSMLTAAGAAAAAGVRVFTATSSQGLLYAMEMLYTVAGWRVPLVLVNVSRAVAAPITLEPDHEDILAARDCGWLQLHAETCQEVLDSILIGYRLSEDPRVRLPVLVNLDGFHLSFTREPVEIPEPEAVAEFLPPFDPQGDEFRARRPLAQGVAVLGGSSYSFFRYQMHRAAEAALEVHEEVAERFCRRFGRCYGAIESYRMEDAEYVLLMSNSASTLGKAAVDRWRAAHRRFGLLRLRLLRPFPHEELGWLLRGRRAVAVIDQNLSIGKGGILHSEVASVLAGRASPPLLSFVGGLGGRRFAAEDFERIAADLESVGAGGDVPPARLLYSEAEMEQMKRLAMVAGHPEAAGEPG